MDRTRLVLLVAGLAVALFVVVASLGGSPILVQVFVVGSLNGGLYGIAGSGLALIYGVLRILNIAHGELIILGAYIAFWLFTLYDLDPLISFLASMAVLALLGAGMQRFLMRPVTKYGFDAPLIVAFGLLVVIQVGMTMLWTGNVRATTTSYSGLSFSLGAIVVPFARLLILAIALVVLGGLHLLLTRTYVGKAIRAVSQDWEAAELCGISMQRVHLLSFILGAALAGLAGTFFGVVSSFTPTSGPPLLLKVLAVIVLGGIGSVLGTLVAGFIIGLLESFGSFLVGTGFGDVVVFGAFILVLVAVPRGLFGREVGG